MNNIIPFQFDAHSLRVQVDELGSPWFNASDACDALGMGNPSQAVKSHVDPEDLQKLETLTAGGRQLQNHINESGLYSLILGSTKEEAKRFKRWITSEVLPSIRKTGGYAVASKRPATMSRNQVAASILLLRSAAEDLKFAPSAVLGGYQRIESQLGVTGLLPGYAVDSANTSSGSSDETRAASELLEKFNVGMGAAAFNRLLMQHGILEERERASSNGGTKKFKVCVNIAYGKNLTSPSNPRETQPHWYVSTFQELVDLVMPSKSIAA